MGEIFRREAAKHPEPFTRERLTTAIGGQVQIEHYHRYLFARSLAHGCDVLDVASGEGYGAALLAQVARSVIGVEYSAPTARAASANFSRSNLRFLQGDARNLPLTDRSLDLVVSFETIEHFDRQDDFLREIRRVLRPEGLCIISTPDRDVYSPTGSAANPYHVQELSRQEFAALLGTTFQHVTLVQQRVLIGSALLADTAVAAAPLVFDRRGDTHFEACIGLPRAPYLIALASDGGLPPLPPSLYIDRSDLDTDALRIATVADQLERTQAELGQSQAELGQSQAKLAHSVATLQDATLRAERLEADRVALQQRNAALQREHDIMQGSLRRFLRGYLPRLRRHLGGQRQ